MDQLLEWFQLILSIGLVCCIALLPFSFHAARATGWSREAIAAGPTPYVPLSPVPLNGIRRWIVRTVKRKEAPDGDADCALPR